MSKPSVLAAAVVVLALIVPIGAQAADPIIFTMPIDDTFTTGFCGFPMEVHTTGTAVVHLFLDEAGDFERVIITAPETRLTFTNIATGQSIWTPSVNMVKQTQNADGTRTSSLRGLFWHLIVPGQGVVTADVGRLDLLLTMNEDGSISEQVIFSAGQQEGQFLPMVCTVLD